MIKLDTYLTPYYPESENNFKDQIVVMIDVLRASTTICAALYNGAKEVIPFSEIERAVAVYANLSRDNRFLGGERNGIKPEGFDAGNSPIEYSNDRIENRTIIFTTSNGTKIFVKGKNACRRLIGSFVNQSVVLNEINSYIVSSKEENDVNITFLCAGTNGRISYEDIICAGNFMDELVKSHPNNEISDTADLALNLYRSNKENFREFLKTKSHAKYLKKIGFSKDVDICFEIDKYPVLPHVNESSIKL